MKIHNPFYLAFALLVIGLAALADWGGWDATQMSPDPGQLSGARVHVGGTFHK